MKLDFGRGVKRIFLAMSALGVIIVIIGFIQLVIVLVERKIMEKDIEDFMIRAKGDEKFWALSTEEQKQVKALITNEEEKEHGAYYFKRRISGGWETVSIGAGMFGLFLVCYFVIPWIIKGFIKNEPEDKTVDDTTEWPGSE